jgi:hypothetical protein
MMASTINNPFMVEYARIKSRQIEEIEDSLVSHEDVPIGAEHEK